MADDTRLFHDNNDPDESDLDGVPRVFTHSKCGRDTQLSAACVRRYERDPFRLLGAGALVWCSACGKNARSYDCRWVETGESVHAYYRRLIGRAYLDSPTSWIGRFFLLYGVLGSVGLGVALLAYYHKGGDAETARILAIGGAVLLAVGLPAGALARWRTYRQCAAEYREYQG